MGKRRIDEITKKAVCFDYAIVGMTPLELSLKYGIATNTIWYILSKHDIPRRNQIKGKEQK